MYHLAGEFCPEESVIYISPLVDNRDLLGGAYTASDAIYFTSWLESHGTCLVHTEEGEENPEETENPDSPADAEDPNGQNPLPLTPEQNTTEPTHTTEPNNSSEPNHSSEPNNSEEPDGNTMPPAVDAPSSGGNDNSSDSEVIPPALSEEGTADR
jgi:hypothetical protein